MAKIIIEAPLTTPSARSKLGEGVHWRRLDAAIHLGYRKGARAGVWLVRWRDGKGYKQHRIGVADDVVKAGNLSYSQAETAAKAQVEAARLQARAMADGEPLTVRKAVEDYIEQRDRRASIRKGRPVRSDSNQRLCRYVLGQPKRGQRPAIDPAPIAAVMLHELDEDHLAAWRDALPTDQAYTTKQRLVNDLKAALNSTITKQRKKLPPGMSEIVRAGLKLGENDVTIKKVARDNQILTGAEVERLLRATQEVDREQGWDGDLFRLVLVLATTGSRFAQVSRLRVMDCLVRERTLVVPASYKGKAGAGDRAPQSIPVGSDVIEALIPAWRDREATAPLLERQRYAQAPGSVEWVPDRRRPWHASSEFSRAWNDIRNRALLPRVIPYALRHTSIVRDIRKNLPIRLVAAKHDTSVEMIERHYGRYVVDGLQDMLRAAVEPMVPVSDNVVKFG